MQCFCMFRDCLPDENGSMIEVKPTEVLAGKVLVAPFPPVLHVATGSIVIQPAVPTFPAFLIERCTKDGAFEAIPVHATNPNLKQHMAVPCSPGQEYAFRYRGVTTEGTTPWSELSAFVKVK